MKFKKYNQEQPWLIPPDIEEEIPHGDLSRVINDVIDVLDISLIEGRYKEEGNTAYHPRMMLKILFYSYATKQFSSRRIAKELERNIYYWYLSGKQRPDFRTISLFRLRHIVELKTLFMQIVKYCMALGLADLSLVAIDGTKIKANACRDRFRDSVWFEKRIAEEQDNIDELFRQADRADAEENAQYGENKRGDEIPDELADRQKRLEKIKKIKEELDCKKISKINETDPEANLMKSQGRYFPAYNCQAVVDSKNQVIVMADVITAVADWGQIKPMIGNIQREFSRKPKVVLGDAGYCDGVNLQYLEKEGITGIIADKPLKEIKADLDNRVLANKKFKKDKFSYQRERDVYLCPLGHEIRRTTKNPQRVYRKSGEKVEYYVYQGSNCLNCPSMSDCCRGKQNRKITRFMDEDLREEMAARIRSEKGMNLYSKRISMIEPVFGNIKHNHGFNSFSLRGLFKTRGEFIIMAIVHNIMKMKKHINSSEIDNIKSLLESV